MEQQADQIMKQYGIDPAKQNQDLQNMMQASQQQGKADMNKMQAANALNSIGKMMDGLGKMGQDGKGGAGQAGKGG
jgi:hypothetical protein